MLNHVKDFTQLFKRIAKQRHAFEGDSPIVKNIISDVQTHGDKRLKEFTLQFDGVVLNELRVVENMFTKFSDDTLGKAVMEATENIRKFHQKQLPKSFRLQQNDGTDVSFRWRPIKKIGIYVPGGNYPLLSTVLMNVIPAQVAGVENIIVCTPPQSYGTPNPTVLAVCHYLGIKDVFQVGGAQAIAAMAFGTETIPNVDKIVGPGNRYVATAKQMVSHRVGIDMVAGPTELIVIADETANPTFIAADLISQAEHDKDAFTLLLSTDKKILEKTTDEIQHLIKHLKTKTTAIESLKNNGFTYRANSKVECVEISNRIAPEHVSVQTINPEQYQHKLIAGAIFIGGETPAAWGDYWAGPNHTLPTSGTAKYRGMLSVFDFLVPLSITQASRNNSKSIDAITSMAEAEGLSGHALSAHLRKGDDS